jgi:hypothetical protein
MRTQALTVLLAHHLDVQFPAATLPGAQNLQVSGGGASSNTVYGCHPVNASFQQPHSPAARLLGQNKLHSLGDLPPQFLLAR